MAINQSSKSEKAVRIFCSYSHKDEALRQKLETHLAAMRHSGLIESWSDRKIVPGTDWRVAIKEQLEAADIVLLLVSPTFISSDFCYSVELEQALNRHKNGEVLVIPIALRHCDWRDTLLASLQALPTDARPVTDWSDRDKAFLDVTKGIRKAIENLDQWRANEAAKASRSSLTSPSTPIENNLGVQDDFSRRALSSTVLPKPVEGDVRSRGWGYAKSYFGNGPYASPDWLRTGLEKAKTVARIERNGKGFATAVLVSHEDFPWAPADQPLLLTCEHVISNDEQNPTAISPKQAIAFFELLDVRRQLGDILWSSSYKALNATIVTLAEPVDATPCRIGPNRVYRKDSQVFLIGYPRGGDISFSLWNYWLASNERFLHYRAATEPGSSGSPVFDEEWNMIAIHHKRSNEMARIDGMPGTYEAGEGVSIHAIQQAAGLRVK